MSGWRGGTILIPWPSQWHVDSRYFDEARCAGGHGDLDARILWLAPAHRRALDSRASTSPIHVQAGAPQYIFQPADVPGGTAAPRFTAQRAYNTMHRRADQASGTIPASTTVRYGLLNEDDTIPSADRMPVWAFVLAGGCIRPDIPVPAPASTAPPSPSESPSRCVQWTFASAATGKDLGVVDQQIIS